MTLGSLFDGAGTMPFAAMLCGIRPVWSSEIEKFPCEVTKRRFPDVKQLGDVTKINGAEIEPVDIITFGSPCFPAGTRVLAQNGYVPIEALKVGDFVCTHLGKWKQVEAIGHKMAETITVSGGHYGIECTPNHPFYAKKEVYRHTHRSGTVRELSDASWVEAKDMMGHRFGAIKEIEALPIPQMERHSRGKQPLPISEELMYIVGRWLGDGWVRVQYSEGRPRHYQIFICCNSEKREELSRRLHNLLDGVCKIAEFEERTAVKFRFNHKSFCEWIVQNFGRYAVGKTLPAWVFGLDKALLSALFNGYVDSDGYKRKDGSIVISTVSRNLANGIRTAGEILGYSCGMHITRKPKITKIEGRVVSQRDYYTVLFRDTKRQSVIKEKNFHWYHCRKAEPTGEKKIVYNISVKDDHSYIVEGYAVHNCQDLSVAGPRAGLKGERSGLFMEAVRIIKEMRENAIRTNQPIRPRYAVWENVPGAYSSNGGETSGSCSKNSAKLPTVKFQFLDLRKASGAVLVPLWETDIRSLGAHWTPNIGECPKGVEESGLWQILEERVHPKYYLSAKACLGILRRAERRGKELPKLLREALEEQTRQV